VSEERTLTEQEDLARKIARVRGIDNIKRLISSFKRQEMDNPDFRQYLKEKEAEWEKK
jgi:hypothetical protein